MNATLSVTVDLSNTAVLKIVADFMKALELAGQTQKPVVAVDPETGFVKKDEWLTPERAQEIADKLAEQNVAEKAGKVKKARKERAPMTEVQKAAFRIRVLTGKLAHATDKQVKSELKAKIAEYQAVLDRQPATEAEVKATEKKVEARRGSVAKAVEQGVVAQPMKSKKSTKSADDDLRQINPILVGEVDSTGKEHLTRKVVVETKYADGQTKTETHKVKKAAK